MTSVVRPASVAYASLVARAVRICHAANVMDFNGHVSARDATDSNIMWINNRHAGRAGVTAADIVPFDLSEGRRIGEGIEPPSEWHIHREMYRRRPEVNGIVHSHPPYILTLSSAGQTLRPLASTGTFIPEAGAPVFDSPVLINTEARGRAMADAFGEDAVVLLLRQHGTVVVGGSVEEAVVRMICAEDNAMIQWQALHVGEPTYFHGEELRLMAREHGTPHGVRKYWTYHEDLARRAGALDGVEG